MNVTGYTLWEEIVYMKSEKMTVTYTYRAVVLTSELVRGCTRVADSDVLSPMLPSLMTSLLLPLELPPLLLVVLPRRELKPSPKHTRECDDVAQTKP